MHIASSTYPLSKSAGSIPVSIFDYNNQRKFLHVSQSYEETIERVAKSFRIENPNSLILQTSCLTACRGQHVIIDSSAYPLIWPFLDEIEVVISDDFSTEEDLEFVNGRLVVDKPSRPPSRAPEAGHSRDNSGRAPYLTPPSTSDAVKETVKSIDPLGGVGQQEENTATLAEWKSPFSTPRKNFKAAISPSQRLGQGWSFMENKDEETQETDFSIQCKQEAHSSVNVIKKGLLPVQVDEDSRFDVNIYGPDEQNAQFKLRGRNSVKKVLTAACKNFNLDPTRAHLVLSMEVKVDGEMQIHEFVCAPEDTMALCGVNAGSNLFIKVDPLSSQEPLDDDEYASD